MACGMLRRYHEVLNNVIPADKHDLKILERRDQTKQKTMLLRREQNHTVRLAENSGKIYMGDETLPEFLIQFVQNHLKT